MKLTFLEIAQKELDEAVEYYNAQKEGLGNEFLENVIEALDRIGNYPNAWRQISDRARCCRTQRFPYGIVYQVRSGNEIIVIAVAHLHRKPHYWKDRL